MHETIFHECSLIRRLASPTCMLIYLLNISFNVCMHYQYFLVQLVSPCIHFKFYFSFQSVSLANLGLDSAFTETVLRDPGKEGSAFLSRNAHFSPEMCISTQALYCFAHFWGTIMAGLGNYVMQSLSLQPLPSEIAHCVILAVNRQNGIWIA